jgi:mandelate racemase
MTSSPLAIRSISAVAVSVPMQKPLGTSAQTIRSAPLLLLTLETDGGVLGRSYAFCYLEPVARAMQSMIGELDKFLAGHPVAPVQLAKSLARYFRLTGLSGPLCMIASAVDAAAWDALSTAASMPLAAFLGGALEPVRAYNSNGLGLMSPAMAADEAEALLASGFLAVKMRMGRPTFDDDLAAVRAVRKRLPDDVKLMVDFNQALSFAQAMEFCPRLDGEGIYWIEEPIRHDDFAHAALIASSTTTPLQLGENMIGVAPLFDALKCEATDYVMFDLDRIGGVSGWRLACGLASAAGREVSSHLFPEVSAHLLAATPTGHWLEYVDWANPVLEKPLRIENGMALIPERPGNGMTWNEDAVQRYRLG